MADRDPDTIKQDIDQARDQLASTVDSLAERANPSRIADDIKAALVRFVKKPAVAVSLAGLGALVIVLVVRRIRRALSGQRRRPERNQSVNEKLGGLATRPRRLQLCTAIGRCAVTPLSCASHRHRDVDVAIWTSANSSFRIA